MSVMQNGGGTKKPVTIKAGAVSAKIYHTPTRGNDLHTLVWYEAGKRKRKTFADLNDAKREANLIVAKLSRGQHIVLELSAADRESYALAVDALRPFGIPLHVAVAEFVEARKALPEGCTLTTAVESFAVRHRGSAGKKSVTEVVTEFLNVKEGQVRERQAADLRIHLAPLPKERPKHASKTKRMQPFADRFRGSIGAVTAADINKWLHDIGGGAKRWNNVRSSVVALFGWAQRQGYLPRDVKTEAEMSERKRYKSDKPEIFTPEEMAQLVTTEDDEARLYFVLAAFAGVRQSELLRLRWEMFHFETGRIALSDSHDKTERGRAIPIHPNLSQWLAPYKGRRGALFTRVKAENIAMKIGREIIGHWRHNGLRHSYGSYRLQELKSRDALSIEMGNSADTVRRHYEAITTPDGRVVTPEMAKAYFSIAPEQPANIVAMASA